MKLIPDNFKKFAEIYSDYYPVIYNSIHRKIGDLDTAGDLTQEVFIRFFEKINEIEKPRPWLLGAMKYVLIEHYRKKNTDEADIEGIIDDTNIRYVNSFRDTRIIIQQALEESGNYRSEKDRIIFDLIAVNNYTYSEAARELGMTLDQVRYGYNMVVEKIIDTLKQMGVKNLEDLL